MGVRPSESETEDGEANIVSKETLNNNMLGRWAFRRGKQGPASCDEERPKCIMLSAFGKHGCVKSEQFSRVSYIDVSRLPYDASSTSAGPCARPCVQLCVRS